jgi:hypothetical protein
VHLDDERRRVIPQRLAHSFQHRELEALHVDLDEARPLARGERVDARLGASTAHSCRNDDHARRARDWPRGSA